MIKLSKSQNIIIYVLVDIPIRRYRMRKENLNCFSNKVRWDQIPLGI